MSNIRHRQNL